VKDTKDRPVWFSEPSQADESWGRRGESVTSWVERATLSRARATRRFLNENLAVVPNEQQAALYRALHDRWPSAFFELIVARTLQVGSTLQRLWPAASRHGSQGLAPSRRNLPFQRPPQARAGSQSTHEWFVKGRNAVIGTLLSFSGVSTKGT
jgi:hypothetical protein